MIDNWTTQGPDRALLVSALFPPDVGGSATLFNEVYRRLQAGRVLVLTDRRSNRADEMAAGVPIIRRPLATTHWGFRSPNGLAHHFRVARTIRKLARGRSRILVHCGRALPEGIGAMVASTLGGPAYVCWTHGEDVGTALLSREQTLVMRAVYRRAQGILANSDNTARMLESVGVPRRKIHVIHPGVDPSRFKPENDGADVRARLIGREGVLLLSVGRLQRRKGHDLAIKAVAKLRAEHPSLRYAIVGDGEERSRLESMAVELGVTDRVIFVGEVPADELPHFYAACDVFLLPNRNDNGDIEGFGIVFLEAAATGRPSIGGNSGGVPEAIVEGDTGLLVTGTDVDELSAAIRTLAADPHLRRRMGMSGRERVLQSFTWDVAAAKLSRVHDVLIAGN